MSRLPILRYPDPRLNKAARPVTAFDKRLQTLVGNMAETMYGAPGIGLAAPQVDVHEQIIVIDISEERQALQVFINPEIIAAGKEKAVFDEGCLSVPGIYEEVERPAWVTVRAQDVNGKFFEIRAEGLMAVCIQHEIDHLKGFIFVDYLSQLKRNRIKAKLLKEEREKKREEIKGTGKKK
ncbi:MAG: peptide deformylase [Betaproteobacteria bacterium]|nr:peptide deformylase [Betaproteobacteria bacterium]